MNCVQDSIVGVIWRGDDCSFGPEGPQYTGWQQAEGRGVQVLNDFLEDSNVDPDVLSPEVCTKASTSGP